MSKGTPFVSFRLSEEVQQKVKAALASRNFHSKEEWWSESDWFRAAVMEKLSHRKRGNRKKRSKRKERSGSEVSGE